MLPMAMVNVAVSPALMTAGVIVLASVSAFAVTVREADAAGAVPPVVTSGPVSLTMVACGMLVTPVVIVQPPGGICEPLATTIFRSVTVAPGQVPVCVPFSTIPGGMASTNSAVRFKGAAPVFPSVIVSVEYTPQATVEGEIDLASVAGCWAKEVAAARKQAVAAMVRAAFRVGGITASVRSQRR